jgi:hypothetical protein
MMFTPAVARAYADTYSSAELAELRADCLSVHSGGGEVSKSLGSGSITIRLENCETILENIQEALRIVAAEAGDDDPDLTAEPFSSGFSFANRYIE